VPIACQHRGRHARKNKRAQPPANFWHKPPPAWQANRSGWSSILTSKVWTLDPNFPFHHPSTPRINPEISAPIENQVEVMREFGLRYGRADQSALLRLDNSYTSLLAAQVSR